ncbi:signal peptidase I [Leptospira perolatii]|uniref:Signal peptidase I n=1 Tax=Leptospira perolatii TaxID=2023191 RepID=A0A2M9ZLP0_9LEPT|nr:signal peptidase I [Leptospira perolatii]PJZ70204.1 signal peptidase I [Leptospira perolatii]PJZ72911.1 signal peptidase I [Leptospira perolatii]
MYSIPKGNGEKDKKFDHKKWAKILGVSLSIGFLIAFSIRAWILFPYKLETNEMEPGLKKGERKTILRWIKPSSLFLGDIILLEHPTQTSKVVLARIVGKPGDTLYMKDKTLFRNGIPENEGKLPYELGFTDKRNPFPASFSRRDQFASVQIEDRKYFVLCDNRDECVDSRDFGPIAFEKIIGKIF